MYLSPVCHVHTSENIAQNAAHEGQLFLTETESKKCPLFGNETCELFRLGAILKNIALFEL